MGFALGRWGVVASDAAHPTQVVASHAHHPITHRFLAAAYQPLAAALSKEFVVWGLDLPGHGIAADIPLPCECTPSVDDSSSSSSLLSLQGATQYVVDAIQQAGLQGCYAFGHSAGGALALLAAGQCPELFR